MFAYIKVAKLIIRANTVTDLGNIFALPFWYGRTFVSFLYQTTVSSFLFPALLLPPQVDGGSFGCQGCTQDTGNFAESVRHFAFAVLDFLPLQKLRKVLHLPLASVLKMLASLFLS